MKRFTYAILSLPLAACLFPSLDGLSGDAGAMNDATTDTSIDVFTSDAIITDAVADAAAEIGPIVVVQAAGLAVFGAPQTVVVTMPSPETKGNLNAVAVSWQSAGVVKTISDSDGNTYQVAVPSTSSVDLGHAIYFAKNINGGLTPNVITVATLAVAADSAANDPDVAVVEFSGLDTTAPLETINQANGNSASLNSGNVITTTARSVLFASAVLDYGFSFDGGMSFTPIPLAGTRSGDVVGYEVVQTTGTYAATVTIANPAYWMLQLAVFK